MEHKELTAQWNQGLAALGKRNDALSALQQAVREQRQVVYAKQTEIEHTKMEIRARQDLHETISMQLARNEGAVDVSVPAQVTRTQAT